MSHLHTHPHTHPPPPQHLRLPCTPLCIPLHTPCVPLLHPLRDCGVADSAGGAGPGASRARFGRRRVAWPNASMVVPGVSSGRLSGSGWLDTPRGKAVAPSVPRVLERAAFKVADPTAYPPGMVRQHDSLGHPLRARLSRAAARLGRLQLPARQRAAPVGRALAVARRRARARPVAAAGDHRAKPARVLALV